MANGEVRTPFSVCHNFWSQPINQQNKEALKKPESVPLSRHIPSFLVFSRVVMAVSISSRPAHVHCSCGRYNTLPLYGDMCGGNHFIHYKKRHTPCFQFSNCQVRSWLATARLRYSITGYEPATKINDEQVLRWVLEFAKRVRGRVAGLCYTQYHECGVNLFDGNAKYSMS